MKTIYYSELLGKQFDTEKECKEAEANYKKEKAEKEAKAKQVKAERSADAKAIEDAYKAYMDAEKNYLNLRNQFVKKYGSFHMTVDDEVTVSPLAEFIKFLFD